ncbi:MAG: hypothetical protein K0R82_160 [Flavipsychrobacter sp.]|jgi:hypothetical protein|nr:hypothetical protein [Flavipsychrobacter sp.]
MTRYSLMLTVGLLAVVSSIAQERTFSFGIGPALTYGFAEKTDVYAAKGYSLRFSLMSAAKNGNLKGISLDLTQVSAMNHWEAFLNKKLIKAWDRTNYGNPSVTIAGNLGKEIKKQHSRFSYYGSLGPVFTFQAKGGIGAMAGFAGRYIYYLDEKIAIGVEVSPRCYYLRMFDAPAKYEANAVFVTVPATVNFCFLLGTAGKDKPKEPEQSAQE